MTNIITLKFIYHKVNPKKYSKCIHITIKLLESRTPQHIILSFLTVARSAAANMQHGWNGIFRIGYQSKNFIDPPISCRTYTISLGNHKTFRATHNISRKKA